MKYEERFEKAKKRELKRYRKRALKLLIIYGILTLISIVFLHLFCHISIVDWCIEGAGLLYFILLVFELVRYRMDSKVVEINLWGKI